MGTCRLAVLGKVEKLNPLRNLLSSALVGVAIQGKINSTFTYALVIRILFPVLLLPHPSAVGAIMMVPGSVYSYLGVISRESRGGVWRIERASQTTYIPHQKFVICFVFISQVFGKWWLVLTLQSALNTKNRLNRHKFPASACNTCTENLCAYSVISLWLIGGGKFSFVVISLSTWWYASSGNTLALMSPLNFCYSWWVIRY